MPPRVARPAPKPVRTTPVLSIVDGKKYHQVIENAAAQDKIVVIKIGASFCRACKMLEPKYQRVAKTWTSHNVEFHQISFEDNREFCKDVLGITKLPWTQVLAPSRGHAEVIADGSSIGKLESSLRKTVLDVDVDDLGI
jgi:thiol-disulfide isomerase/thioredoxin